MNRTIASLIFYTSAVDIGLEKMSHTVFLNLNYMADVKGHYSLIGVLFNGGGQHIDPRDIAKRAAIIGQVPRVFQLEKRYAREQDYALRVAITPLRKAITQAIGLYTLLYFDGWGNAHSYHYRLEERTEVRPLVQLMWDGKELVPPEFLKRAA